MTTEEMTDISEQEPVDADSPADEPGVSDDTGSEEVSESQVEEQQESVEESASETEDESEAPAPAQDSEQKAQPAPDYERDYKALQGDYTRKSQELKQLKAEYEAAREKLQSFSDVDPNAIKQFQQQRELPAWNPNSPEHSRFQRAKQTIDVINAAPDLTPEQKQQWLNQQLPAEDINMVIKWGEYKRAEQERMLSDPQSYIASQVQSKVQEIVGSQLSQHTSAQKTQEFVNEMFSKPEFREVYLSEDGKSVSDWGARLNDMLGQGIPFELADKTIRSERELDKIRQENAELRKKTAAASERDRLLRDGATETRDVRVGGVDVYQEWSRLCAERGFSKDSPAGMELLLNLESTTTK